MPAPTRLTRRRFPDHSPTSTAGARWLAGLLAAVSFLLLTGPAAAEWKIVEAPGELRVANGKIGVVLTHQRTQKELHFFVFCVLFVVNLRGIVV